MEKKHILLKKSDVRFEYQRLKVVSTLLGEVNPQISDKKKNFEIKRQGLLIIVAVLLILVL